MQKKRPLRYYETISVFSYGAPIYYPQGLIEGVFNNSRPSLVNQDTLYGKQKQYKESNFTNYPKDVIKYSKPSKPMHSTQKPIDLMEYLIRTYTNEGGTVLDFTMGSGSTGVACVNAKRSFIGIELDDKYFEIAKKRIEESQYKLF